MLIFMPGYGTQETLTEGKKLCQSNIFAHKSSFLITGMGLKVATEEKDGWGAMLKWTWNAIQTRAEFDWMDIEARCATHNRVATFGTWGTTSCTPVYDYPATAYAGWKLDFDKYEFGN